MAFPLIGRKKSKHGETRLVMSEEYTPAQTERIVETNHTAKTIYLDRIVKDNWICPYCEGENVKKTTICCVCGKDMKYK